MWGIFHFTKHVILLDHLGFLKLMWFLADCIESERILFVTVVDYSYLFIIVLILEQFCCDFPVNMIPILNVRGNEAHCSFKKNNIPKSWTQVGRKAPFLVSDEVSMHLNTKQVKTNISTTRRTANKKVVSYDQNTGRTGPIEFYECHILSYFSTYTTVR